MRPLIVWAVATLALLAAPLAAAPAGSAPNAPLLGYWLSAKEKLLLEFYECGTEVCGRIAWLAKPYNSKGTLRRDTKNPDPGLRGRPWCGIEVVRGLRPEGDGTWESGTVYDPKRGRTYSLAVKRKGDGLLELRAYVGLKLLGKTEVWSRPAPDQEIGCVPDG
jgi:uncharacterized protein (DUF2147 family)